jgi:PAS domain S-box-containing protein
MDERATVENDPLYRAAVEELAQATDPRPEHLARARAAARGVGFLVLALSVAVDIAWALDFDAFNSVLPGSPETRFWTASGLGLVALLIAFPPPHRSPLRSRVWRFGAVVVIAVNAFFLLEYAAGVSIAQDNPFNLDPSSSRFPRRPPAMAALNLMLLGIASLQLARNRVRQAQWVALVVLAIAVVALNAYAFDASRLFSIGVFSTMTLRSAIATLLLSLALLSLTAGAGFMTLISGSGNGSLLVRRILPASMVAQLLVGSATYQAVDHLDASPPFAFAVGATLSMGIVAVLVGYQGHTLRNSDLHRTGAETALSQMREVLETRNALARRLRASERQVRQIIESTPDGFVSVDSAGCVTEWNAAAERMFGYSPDEVMGRPLHEIIVPEYRRAAYANGFGDYVARMPNISGRPMQVMAARRDGHLIPIELTIWPPNNTSSNTLFHAFARDITDRKAAEQQLLQVNNDLQEFAAVAAHDLRNPLVAIRLSAELLETYTEGEHTHEQASEWIARIIGATNRGQELIADLLEYSRFSNPTHERVAVDLNLLVKDVVDELREGTDRPLNMYVADLPTIDGDEPRLRQLFANLIGNAGKYVPSDRDPTLHITARETPTGHEILVADNGNGVPDSDKESIFAIFQRGSTTDGQPGTGLGLAICRKVMERHGGSIRVEDAPGGGACFVVAFPR